ncbi:MAG: type IV pilus twitching motility protein PilT [Rickettsiales bacterium]|nr:type IV pilus twitching motility protein PilT [Rickettsiales bacterium]
MNTLIEILRNSKKLNCSDVHISSKNLPMYRLDGDMVRIEGLKATSPEEVAEMLDSIMSDTQKKIYKERMELDFSIQVEENLRFRVNAFNTINGPAAAFREIPIEIKSLTAINAPEVIRRLSYSTKGLILVVGPTGSGKSTTLAALIDQINISHPKHIITIEDPVEFIHKNKTSMINQRELGGSTLSFANALKSSLREDPDVILVGELRDIETIHLALTAAETGHLVLATLHTSSAAQTINRIIDVFPTEDKPIIRSMLSTSIRAIISQRLLKKEGKGRCAAYEIMIANGSIRNLIREDKIPQINSIIELGKQAGMLTLKDSVVDLLKKGLISKETHDETLVAIE